MLNADLWTFFSVYFLPRSIQILCSHDYYAIHNSKVFVGGFINWQCLLSSKKLCLHSGFDKNKVSIVCQLRCRRSNERKLTKVLNKSTRIYAYSHFRKEESLPWFQNQSEAKAILKSSLISCTSNMTESLSIDCAINDKFKKFLTMKLSVQITDRNNKVSVVANGSNYSRQVTQRKNF